VSYKLDVGVNEDFPSLILSCSGSLVVAMVFMVTPARVLERLNIVPSHDKL